MRSLRVAAATLLALVASACSDVTSPAATAPSNTDVTPSFALVGGTGATGQIVSTFATGKCIDVADVSRSAGARTQIWSCSGGVNQQWTWQSDGTIRVYDGTMCLDAAGGQGNNGDAVGIWTCTGATNQKWSATSAGEIKGVNAKCIDITDVSSANGARLQLWTCSGGKNQKWDNSGAALAPAPAPAPTPAPAPAPTGIAVSPGQSIQSAVNANPTGTAFVIKAGTHTRQSVIPKAGNTFAGEAGAVMDGQNATGYAFYGRSSSGWVHNVTIRGIKIINYAPPAQMGAITAGNAPGDASNGWVVDGNEISNSQQYGIRIGDGIRVTNNNVHHNVVLNIGGGANNALVEGNEIAWGNAARTGDTNYESGGTKFVLTDGLVVRGNYVHDNQGVGLWMDEGNINVLVEGNRVENNASEGIVHEKGYKATFRNNTVKNNGWSDPRGRRWFWNAGIGIHASPDVEIYGNTVSGNMNGIVAIQQNRGSGPHGEYRISNLYVHDNTVTQTTLPPPYQPSAAGALVQDNGDTGVWSRNNRFANNTYYLGSNSHPFEWGGSWHTESGWRGLGQDLTGKFYR